jgi:hypothetical protein
MVIYEYVAHRDEILLHSIDSRLIITYKFHTNRLDKGSGSLTSESALMLENNVSM